ncbi:DUF3302 domain-containing protein [Reyranella sp.]|uniref:DUF3302 domain-containing protein n=1 Tax=Reyranella sp. TaxID=1929291 RepID=UPI003BA8E79B
MVLDYVALAILIVVVCLVVYGVVAVYGIPHQIARARHHPHADAIGAATWVSLFTLGVLWPFLWIWAMAYRPDRGWGFAGEEGGEDLSALEALDRRVAALEQGARR